MRADVQLGEHPAAAGQHQRHHAVVGEADLLPGVEVVVVGRGLDPRFRPPGRTVENVVGSDQRAIDRVAKVRQIDAAERPVPMAAIALGPIKLGAGRFDKLPGRAVVDGVLQATADHHHAAVHLVGLGILHLEVPPETAADEPLQRRQPGVVVHLMA